MRHHTLSTRAVDLATPAPRGMLEFWADPNSPYHRAEFDPSRRIIASRFPEYCAPPAVPNKKTAEPQAAPNAQSGFYSE